MCCCWDKLEFFFSRSAPTLLLVNCILQGLVIGTLAFITAYYLSNYAKYCEMQNVMILPSLKLIVGLPSDSLFSLKSTSLVMEYNYFRLIML